MFLKGKIDDERTTHKPTLVPERKYEAPNVGREIPERRPNIGLARGSHRPGPKIGSSGGAGIRLVNPIKNLSSAAASHIAGLKTPKASLTVDMDEVPEDVRVTNLLESVMPLVDDTAGVGPAGGGDDDIDDVEL